MRLFALFAFLLVSACSPDVTIEDPEAPPAPTSAAGKCPAGEFFVLPDARSAQYADPDELGTCQPLRQPGEGCAEGFWCESGACDPSEYVCK